MTLWKLFAISAGSFVLFHFVFARLARLRWHKAVGRAAIPKGGACSAIEFLRTLSIFGTVVYGTLVVAILVAGMIGGATAASVGGAIERLEPVREVFGGVSGGISKAFFVFLLVALAAAAYRSGKQSTEKVIQKRYEDELTRLTKAFEKGDWEDLPPTADMQKIEAMIDELIKRLEEAHATQGVNPEDLARFESQVFEQIAELKRTRMILDIQRRMDLSWDPGPDSKPKTWYSRLGTFFVSEGLMSTFKTGSRFMFRVGMFLLLVSLVGVASPVVATSIGQRVLALEDLQVRLTAEEASESWEEAIAAGGGRNDEPLTDEDEELLDHLASAYEEAVYDALAEDSSYRDDDRYEFRAYSVRARIVARAASNSASVSRIGHGPSMSKASGLSDVEVEALSSSEKYAGRRGPKTELGRAWRSQVREEVAIGSKRQWQSIKTNTKSYMKSFQVPAEGTELSRAAMSKVLGQAFDVVPIEVDGELAKQAQYLSEKITKDRLMNVYDTTTRRYLLDIAEGVDPATAADRIRAPSASRRYATGAELDQTHSVSRSVPSDQAVMRKLRSQPPGFTVEPESHVDMSRASRTVADLHASSPRTSATRAVEALAGYDDFFPGQYGGETRTPRGRQLAKLSPNDFPVVNERMPPTPARSNVRSGGTRVARGASAGAFRRSRSFVRLRGFSRVGGVLIGREPTEAVKSSADFRDFTWTDEDGKLEFQMTRADGTRIMLGPFNKTLTYSALAYAADGRPVAVTMTSAQPLAELRILCHPALIDTPFGCEVISIDRFVDEFTGGSPERNGASAVVASHFSCYEFAWAARAGNAIERYESDPRRGINLEETQLLLSYKRGVASRLQNQRMIAAVEAVIADPGQIDDVTVSPLTVKKEFFDQQLVSLMRMAAKSASTVEEFIANIESQFHYQSSEISRYLAVPPTYQVWSGVRELEFVLDPDLQCLQAPVDGGDLPFWPLDFMLQVAFTSPPEFASTSVDPEQYSDEHPWEFPGIENSIRDRVSVGVENSPEHLRTLEHVQEFTILQRLFRLGFDGRLGQEFPVEKFAELLAETEAYKGPYARTLRWNARPGYIEFILQQQLEAGVDALAEVGALDGWTTAVRADMQRCANFIAGFEAPQLVSISRWNTACNLDRYESEAADRCGSGDNTACYVLDIIDAVQQIAKARELRQALGVSKDDRQSRSQYGCASLN